MSSAVRNADSLSSVLGVNVTLMVQDDCAAKLVPQVPWYEKSEAFVPVKPILETPSGVD